MKTNTLWQRLTAETPAFFKRAQLFGAGLMSLALSLSHIGTFSDRFITILSSVGATIVAISQFAIKQYSDSSKENDSHD